MAIYLGFDTSNYKTSAALFDSQTGKAWGESRFLQVPEGSLGLRQSEALFQHVRSLGQITESLFEKTGRLPLAAVGYSARPRNQEGSYMPCFLAGESQGRTLAAALNVPFFACSHQQGHIAAAAWSAGRMDLLDRPMLAWHLSGGTTELLHVEPEGVNVKATLLGGTSDISAGQLIDRTGVLLGLPFPAGKAVDQLAQAGQAKKFTVKLNDFTFSLSGMENKVKAMAEQGAEKADIARFALLTVADVVRRTTLAALKQYPGLPVLCSGGVASNSLLRQVMEPLGAVFAQPRFSTDNAMGAAILTWRAVKAGELT